MVFRETSHFEFLGFVYEWRAIYVFLMLTFWLLSFTVTDTSRQRQPSDISKTFIKYCFVGWGLPAVIVVLCTVLDFTGTFRFGYGL